MTEMENIVYNLENQCKLLMEGHKKQIIVKKLSNEMFSNIKRKMSQAGCRVLWDEKSNIITILKPKVSKEDENLLAGLNDLNTDVDGLDEKVAQAKKEAEQAKKFEYIAKLSLDFNKKLLYILKNYNNSSKKELMDKLNELNEIISNYEVIGDEREKNNILLGLNTLKKIYKNDNSILKKVNLLIKKVKKSKLNKELR